jgi:hypothetical protein
MSGPRFVRVGRDAAGRVRRGEELGAEIAADLLESVRARAAFARAAAPPSDDDGLRMARIDRFLAVRGLPTPPAVVMSPAAAASYREALARAGYTFAALDALLDWEKQGRAGFYVREIGMVLSYRAIGMDAWTQVHLVHEKAHAFELPAEFTAELTGHRDGPGGPVNVWDVQMPRAGFIVASDLRRPPGEFLEEGFAAMLEAEYARDVLGGEGLWEASRPLPPPLAGLPRGYVWKSPHNNDPVYSSTAFAGAALDLLIQSRPALYQALIRARLEVGGLRETVRLINSVQPGLYRQLGRPEYRYSDEGFGAGLDAVRAVLGSRRGVSIPAAPWQRDGKRPRDRTAASVDLAFPDARPGAAAPRPRAGHTQPRRPRLPPVSPKRVP